MSNIPLQTLKFPGIDRVYTIPEPVDIDSRMEFREGAEPSLYQNNNDITDSVASLIDSKNSNLKLCKNFVFPINTVWRSLEVSDECIVAIPGYDYNYGPNSYFSTQLAYSNDGINWNLASIPNNNYSCCAYGNGRFVAVAGSMNGIYSSSCAYSDDGINWMSANMPVSTAWLGIAYGNGKFVAVGITNIAYSEDGINWTAINNTITTKTIYSIAFSNNLFIAVGTDVCLYSTDGISWTLGSMPEDGITFYSIAAYNGVFYTNKGNTVYYTEDGISWLTSLNGPGISEAVISCCNDKIVALTRNSYHYRYGTSTNGFTFISTLPFYCSNIKYFNSYYIAIPVEGDKIAYSTDCINWSVGGTILKQNNEDVTEDFMTLIPSGLPEVTSDDNDKFLRVVDGVWTAVALPNAEEASF